MSAISAVQKEFCRIAFQPLPPPQTNGPFVGLFSPKFSHFLKTAILTIELLKWIYFDNGNGQTLSLDGIVMDIIMVENGEV